MKKMVSRAIRLMNNYGPIKGSVLFFKIQFGNTKSLTVPHVKHPFLLRPKTSDLTTFLQVFAFDEYKINFDHPINVIDCGANIGLFSIYMKSRYPASKIICVEPDPENFQVLQQNLSSYENVHFERSGIWNKDARLKINDKYDFGKWGVMVEEDPENGTIPAISIASIMQKYDMATVDVLKIDIETSEKQLFSSGYKEWLPKVKTIVIEFHDWLLPGCSKTFFEAINQTFSNYEFKTKGENVIIVNKDIA